jgi:hypothetical protein
MDSEDVSPAAHNGQCTRSWVRLQTASLVAECVKLCVLCWKGYRGPMNLLVLWELAAQKNSGSCVIGVWAETLLSCGWYMVFEVGVRKGTS